MKKLVSFLLSAVVCSALCAATASAANVNIDVDKTEVKVGDIVTVEVSVPDITAATFSTGLQFSTEDFECVDLYGAEGKEADPLDKEWFYLVDKDARRNPEVDADPGPSIDFANANGVISGLWSSSGNVNYAAGVVFTAELKAKKATTANIVWFEETDVDGTTDGDVSEEDTIAIVIKGDEPVTPPAPTASVAIKGAYKTTDANWIAEKGNTMFWGVDFANGGFNGTAVAKFVSGDKERELIIATPAEAEINGEASFGVFVIVGDSTDAIGLTITSGDVTATAAPVAYADAE